MMQLKIFHVVDEDINDYYSAYDEDHAVMIALIRYAVTPNENGWKNDLPNVEEISEEKAKAIIIKDEEGNEETLWNIFLEGNKIPDCLASNYF